MSLTIEIHVL